MMTYVLCMLYCISTICAFIFGRTAQAGQALMEGAQAAISFAISIGGAICLWSGICELMERCGAAAILSRLLRRPLKKLFPQSSESPETMAALSENVSANILGLGNAATPAGIRAAKAMAKRGSRDELCMLVVLNTASIQLIPSTIAAVRQAAGAQAAFDIIPAVWFSSLVSLAVALGAANLLRRLWS
ncbi:MAG: spore maturation protein A [Oscillospiraceae bacterium]|nr:spore maturation protein A [Oscillospiraceae bacterium]